MPKMKVWLNNAWVILDAGNADSVGGRSAGTAAGNVLVLDGSAKVPTANIPPITGAMLAANTIGSGQLANGAVTDIVIGNRTIVDALAASNSADNITNLLSKLGNMIKALSGKASWITSPAITLETASTYLDQNVKSTATPTFAGVILQNLVSDPASPVNGQMWFIN